MWLRFFIGMVLFVVCHGCSGDDGAELDAAPSSEDAAIDGAGGATACHELSPCPAPDNEQVPEITCVSPDPVQSGRAVTLHILGRYVKDDRGETTKIAFSGEPVVGGNVKNGEPRSACHLTVELGGDFFEGAGPVEIEAITSQSSDAFTIQVE